MSIISYSGLVELVEQGVITGVLPDAINGTSIDVHLGNHFQVESLPPPGDSRVVDLAQRQSPTYRPTTVTADHGLVMDPGEFVLAHTVEMFHLTDTLSSQFMLKSSLARAGLGHALATWADPTWNSSTLTLELHNLLRIHSLRLTPGMPIGQMIFHRHAAVPARVSYAVRGRYNHDAKAQPQKP